MRSPGSRSTDVRLLPLLLALCVLCSLLLGCGSGSTGTTTSKPRISTIRSLSTPASITYLGAIPGTQALIGLVVNGTEARAYVCDGTPTRLATLVDWFTGQWQRGTLAATGPDGLALQVQGIAQSASGRLTLTSGRVYAFSLPKVAATAEVGVFEATVLIDGKGYHAGWLLLPGGEQRGAALYYPTGPIRGQAMIALLEAYPTGPV
jgi:hypothetical protein